MRISQRWVAVVLFAVALLCSPVIASADDGGAITLGSSLGFSVLMVDDSDDVTQISIPEGNSIIAASPGLRIGHVSPSRGFEFGFGTSFLYFNSDGSSSHILVFGIDGQKHFVKPSSNWNLFIAGELGLATYSDFFLDDATQPYFGATIGGRNIIADDHGALKLGLTLRQHMEDEDSGLASYTELAFRLMFDLWIPK